MTNKNPDIVKIIYAVIATMLFLAIAHMPYKYYTFIRFIVCAGAGFTTYRGSISGDKSPWPWVCALVAVVFNPLVEIHMSKGVWAIVDAATGVLFCFLAYRDSVNVDKAKS